MENLPEAKHLPDEAAALIANREALLEALNPRQRLFLMGLLDGKSVRTAYEQAGYDGDAHAAYVLKSRLERELEALAGARGCSKADLKVSLVALAQKPLVDKWGAPIAGITVDQYLKLLDIQRKVLEAESAHNTPTQFTKIVIGQVVSAPKVVDTTVVPSGPETSGE